MTAGPPRVDVVALAPEHLAAFAALFEASSSSCYCRYWHFTGTKNDWLARSAMEPDASRAENEERVRLGDPAARGLLAIDGGAALGWMKLAPRATLPKLRAQSVYRTLDLGEGDGVYSVGCFLVRPDARRRGVARALVAAAPDFVRAWGGRAIEAYPRRLADVLHDEEAWMGPEHLFLHAGFAPVAGEPPYVVYRRDL